MAAEPLGYLPMLEIEQKYRVPALAPLAARLDTMPYSSRREYGMIDRYYLAPDRDFHQIGETLRLRMEQGSFDITYKGPKLTGPMKTRRELRVPLAGDHRSVLEMGEMLAALGYKVLCDVQKSRNLYVLEMIPYAVCVCLDTLPGIGMFVEVEVVCKAQDREQGESLVQSVAAQLGLVEPEPRSYLELFLMSKAPATSACDGPASIVANDGHFCPRCRAYPPALLQVNPPRCSVCKSVVNCPNGLTV